MRNHDKRLDTLERKTGKGNGTCHVFDGLAGHKYSDAEFVEAAEAVGALFDVQQDTALILTTRNTHPLIHRNSWPNP